MFQLRKLFGHARELFVCERNLFIGVREPFIRACGQDGIGVSSIEVQRGIHWRSFPPECHPKEGCRISTVSRTHNTQCSFDESMTVRWRVWGRTATAIEERGASAAKPARSIRATYQRHASPACSKIAADPGTPACRRGHGRGRARRSDAGLETPCRD